MHAVVGVRVGWPGHFPLQPTGIDACELTWELGCVSLETLVHASLLLGATL